MAEAKRALITGASSGIGHAFARRLARDGYDLVLVARRADRLTDLARDLGGEITVETMSANLTDDGGIRALEDRLRRGDVTMLINNAGFGNYGPFVETDPDRAEAQIMLHCTAVVRACRAALPAMVARNDGAIINVSSSFGFSGDFRAARAKRATYAATKAFLNTFTRLLAQELEGSGVRVQALCPGVVRTEFHDRLGGRPPGIPVAEPDAVVEASLTGLDLGEVLCVPTLADPEVLSRFSEAEQKVFTSQAASAEIALRYRKPTG